MGQPYVGEIRIFAGNFAPAGWMFCEGQLVPISQFDTLFNLIGTTYGGDGQTTFALPDLRGRVPIHQGNNGGTVFTLAQNGGAENITLTLAQIPTHSHTPNASTSSSSDNPTGNFWGKSNNGKPYVNSVGGVPAAMNAASVLAAGGSQPHNNFQPYLCLDYIISMFGIFPSP